MGKIKELIEITEFLESYLLKKNFMSEKTVKKISELKNILQLNDNEIVMKFLKEQFLTDYNLKNFSEYLVDNNFLKEFVSLYLLEDYLKNKTVEKIDVKVVYEM